MKTELWICGEILSGGDWGLVGIFSTQQKAIDECKTELYFIAPIELDEVAPEGENEFPGVYFPRCIGWQIELDKKDE